MRKRKYNGIVVLGNESLFGEHKLGNVLYLVAAPEAGFDLGKRLYGLGYLSANWGINQENAAWFDSIKPAITPPNLVFAIVWNILYFFIAVSLFLAWQAGGGYHRKLLVYAYGTNLFFNFIWTYIFFEMRNPLLAFADIILVLASIILIMRVDEEISKEAFQLMVPYLIWILFAIIINYFVVV